jgi:hypothetical protein
MAELKVVYAKLKTRYKIVKFPILNTWQVLISGAFEVVPFSKGYKRTTC